jgi:hypothetical protein
LHFGPPYYGSLPGGSNIVSVERSHHSVISPSGTGSRLSPPTALNPEIFPASIFHFYASGRSLRSGAFSVFGSQFAVRNGPSHTGAISWPTGEVHRRKEKKKVNKVIVTNGRREMMERNSQESAPIRLLIKAIRKIASRECEARQCELSAELMLAA